MPFPYLPLPEPEAQLVLMQPIWNRLRGFGGWLTRLEMEALVSALSATIWRLGPQAGAVVEIGSYVGRSTTALASVLQILAPSQKVFAIDPHQGYLDDPVTSLPVQQPSSLPDFEKNIAATGLGPWVQMVLVPSTQVQWHQQPIMFMFIDGLHSYADVKADFEHFQPHLLTGAIVCFHDYSKRYPGVVQFLQELISTTPITAKPAIATLLGCCESVAIVRIN